MSFSESRYACYSNFSRWVYQHDCPSFLEIADGPRDKTVFRGRDAVFSCVVRDAPGHWILNDTNIDDLPGALRDDLFHDSVSAAVFYYISLRIPGRVEYNGTRVKCAIENDGDNNLLESESAVLKIQGEVCSYNLDLKCGCS